MVGNDFRSLSGCSASCSLTKRGSQAATKLLPSTHCHSRTSLNSLTSIFLVAISHTAVVQGLQLQQHHRSPARWKIISEVWMSFTGIQAKIAWSVRSISISLALLRPILPFWSSLDIAGSRLTTTSEVRFPSSQMSSSQVDPYSLVPLAS